MGKISRRFYFDIDTGDEIIQDDEGVEAFSLEQALMDARAVIQEMAGRLDESGLDTNSMLIVRDANGATIAQYFFRELLDHVVSLRGTRVARPCNERN